MLTTLTIIIIKHNNKFKKDEREMNKKKNFSFGILVHTVPLFTCDKNYETWNISLRGFLCLVCQIFGCFNNNNCFLGLPFFNGQNLDTIL